MRVEVIYFAYTKVISTTYPTETSLITDLNPGAESIPDETLWNGRPMATGCYYLTSEAFSPHENGYPENSS